MNAISGCCGKDGGGDGDDGDGDDVMMVTVVVGWRSR